MKSSGKPGKRPFLPLKGVRVLAFEVAYSLPAGTRTLAELGAEVVRVVGPGRDSFYIGVVDGVYFSKDCVGIDLKTTRGLELAKELVAKADIVCSNFVGGVMEKLGLGYDVLASLSPSVIALQLSGFGAPGPWSTYPAFGPSTEAAGGMNRLIGEDPEPPIRIGSGVFSDQLGGRFAALALIAALEERQRTGKGRFVDLSMVEAISLLIGNTVADAALGIEPPRLGNRDRDYAPQGVYRCKGEDDWIAITIKDDRAWNAFRAEMGEAAPTDTSFTSAEGRRAGHLQIDAAIEGWTVAFDKDELAARLQQLGIAAHGVAKSRDPLFDRHLGERGLFKDVAHERPILGYAAHPHPTTPWFPAGYARPQLSGIHFHGHDNIAVLSRWLGYEPEQVALLEAEGALIRLSGVEVEDRRTNYRDADFAEQLHLSTTPSADEPSLPLVRRQETPVATRTRPLRILELGGGPAAGFAGMLLALLGHDVVRVSGPGGAPLDYRSRAGAERETARLSDIEWAFLNRGKQSRELDVWSEWEELRELATGADAVIEDLGPPGLKNCRIAWRTLRELNRNLVVASISPFGLTGPKHSWSASELILQASGPLHSSGWRGERPFKAGGYSAHHIAGVNAATAVLAAAYGVAAGASKGVHLDISMQECYIHHWTRHIGEWTYSGTKMHRERKGFGHQGFRHTAMAADGWLYLLALFASWDEIALFLGLDDFITLEWQDPEYRAEHWPELEQPYHDRLATRGRYEWFAEAAEAGYTWAPVHSAKDQLSNVQFAARGFLKPAEILGKSVRVPGLPFAWSSQPRAAAGGWPEPVQKKPVTQSEAKRD